MSSRGSAPGTTTWQYNHFAGKYFGHHNDQDLLRRKARLRKSPIFQGAQILSNPAG
jgi:hypothetical protein